MPRLSDRSAARVARDDLQLAFDIQQGLLPQAGIKCDKWHVYHAYEPAGIVSGDYVDIIEHGDEFYFLLGDVSGKGMAASLLMSNLHAAFHSLVPMGLPMTELMKRANRLLCSSLSNQYATLICGRQPQWRGCFVKRRASVADRREGRRQSRVDEPAAAWYVLRGGVSGYEVEPHERRLDRAF